MKTGPDRQKIINLLRNEEKPVDLKTIMHRLKIHPSYRSQVKKILRELGKEGGVYRGRNKFSSDKPKSNSNTITGRVDIRHDFGFIVTGDGNDIFMGSRAVENLLPGDIVEADIIEKHDGRREGILRKVVSRTEAPVMCRVRKQGPALLGFLMSKQMPVIRITDAGGHPVKENDIVLVKVSEKDGVIEGRVISYMYDRDDIKSYKSFILDKYEIRRDFPDEAESAAASVEQEKDLKRRLDLRNDFIITIDPVDARDFDDAVSLKKENEGWALGVHIADVSNFVTPGGALDEEARLRGNSVYLPKEVYPMLPEKLSNGICSLVEGEDRMTFSVLMKIDKHGEIESYEIAESVIKSAKRLTYEEAQEIIEGERETDPKLKETLLAMNELKEVLKAAAKRRGSVDFALGEPKLVFNAAGEVEDIIRKVQFDAHRLVEFFMIAANVCAADFILKRLKAGMFRIHPKPFVKDIDDFNNYMKAMGLGVRLKRGTNADFQRVVASIENDPRKQIIERKLLRSMQLAKYSEKNSGHFGLGLEKYSHFTSPIRRYADLVLHRLIKALLSGEKENVPDRVDLKDIAFHISGCEERAERSENEVFKVYALDFLREMLGEETEAIVTKVTQSGLVAELKRYPVEGFITFDSMGDYFYFERDGQRAVGKRTKKIFRTGCEISVIITRVDLENQKLELETEA